MKTGGFFFFKLSFILCFILFLVGCSPEKKIEIGEISDLQIKSFKDNTINASVNVSVKNSGMFAVKIYDSEIELWNNDRMLGKAIQQNVITVSPRSDKKYQLDFTLSLENTNFEVLLLLKNILNNEAKLKLKGHITTRMMGVKKQLNIDKNLDNR